MNRRVYLLPGLLILIVALLLPTVPAHSSSPHQSSISSPDRQVVTGIDYLGQAFLPAGAQFEGTTVGGLSAITYDPARGIYYALSDDPAILSPARFYSMTFTMIDGALSAAVTGVTTLLDKDGNPIPTNWIDPEGIAYAGGNELYISSESNFTRNASPTYVAAFGMNGRMLQSLAVPDKFLRDSGGARGVRPNRAFESLTVRPDGRYLFTAVENALAQDGPVADLTQGSAARVIVFDRATAAAGREYVYITDPVAEEPVPEDGDRQNGLSDLLALDNNGSFLALERSYSEGLGFTIKLFAARAQGALDVSSIDSLADGQGRLYGIDAPLDKELLLDLNDLPLPIITNMEGMTLGPVLEDGRRMLILVADNNFSQYLPTQFIALALTMESIPAALPDLESPRLLDQATVPDGSASGRAGDAVIWVHPTNPDGSLVIAALGGGGLQALDLSGQALQTVAPKTAGARRFDDVDLIYSFSLAGEKVDLAVASDNAEDTLALFRIDPQTRRLDEAPSVAMPRPLFGGSGGAAAHRLATYTSPFSGRHYVFVSPEIGNRVVQLELKDDGAGGVTAAVVRTIELPVPSDARVGDLAADRLLGDLFVAADGAHGILSYSAEPGGGAEYRVIPSPDAGRPESGFGALAIYYGWGRSGYLLAADRSDRAYALFTRADDHAWLGRFVVGDNGPIDQATGVDGIAVGNASLGSSFPQGLLVVQDDVDEPQNVLASDGRLANNSANFKFVPWPSVAGRFSPPLSIDPGSHDPRYPMRILFPTVSGTAH